MKVAGMTVAGNVVSVVVISGSVPFDCLQEIEFTLQEGDRPRAYCIIQGQIKDFLEHAKVERVALKASSVSGGAATDALLTSAELRGVVQVAIVEARCQARVLKRGPISRVGEKTLKEYLSDEEFWATNLPQLKKKGLREAAFFAIKGIE
jgi:hypothetical protein